MTLNDLPREHRTRFATLALMNMAEGGFNTTTESETSSLEWDLSCLQLHSRQNVFDPEKLQVLDNWIIYHQKSLEFYQSLRATYTSSGELSAYAYDKVHSKDLPKKPKTVKFYEQPKTTNATVSSNFEPAKTSSKSLESLRGLELLEELRNFIAEGATDGNVAVFSDAETSVEIIEQNIIKGEKFISYKHKAVLRDAVNLSLWMQRLIEIRKESFADFVDQNCTFKVRWAYKLRGFATVFGKYKHLQNLDISLTTAIKLCKHIDLALSTHSTHAEFWSN